MARVSSFAPKRTGAIKPEIGGPPKGAWHNHLESVLSSLLPDERILPSPGVKTGAKTPKVWQPTKNRPSPLQATPKRNLRLPKYGKNGPFAFSSHPKKGYLSPEKTNPRHHRCPFRANRQISLVDEKNPPGKRTALYFFTTTTKKDTWLWLKKVVPTWHLGKWDQSLKP